MSNLTMFSGIVNKKDNGVYDSEKINSVSPQKRKEILKKNLRNK